MNELMMTVAGWAATDVRLNVGQGDLAIASFRLASTPRYFDRERSIWVDGVTEWFTVRAFRSAAITIEKSIKKGQPVVVSGRFRTSTWESKEGPRTDQVIDAVAVGHDCTRGVAAFSRATGDASMGVDDVSRAAEAITASRGEAAALADRTGEPPVPDDSLEEPAEGDPLDPDLEFEAQPAAR